MGLTIYAGGNPETINKIDSEGLKKEGKNKKSTVFAGNLNLSDTISEKRRKAKEEAWQVVSNAWNSDTAVEDTIQKRRDLYDEMKALEKESKDSLSEISKEEAALKEMYGIDKDSKEQKDLELLKKKQDISNGVSDTMFTPEEAERLKNIDMDSLTEYQKRVLELNDRAAIYKNNLKEAEKQMKDAVSDINSIQLERLKTHPMVDAMKQADAIKAAASDEIIGEIVQDAKEETDKKLEDEEEKAKEEAEKNEKKEEKLEDIKEQQAVREAVMTGTKEAVEKAKAIIRDNEAPDIEIEDIVDITKNNPQGGEVKKNLEEIKNSMNLLEADLKGIKVDENI